MPDLARGSVYPFPGLVFLARRGELWRSTLAPAIGGVAGTLLCLDAGGEAW